MRRFNLAGLVGVGLLALGCSGGDGDGRDGGTAGDAGLQPYGHACEKDDDCATGTCLEYVADRGKGIKKKVCTKTCKRLSDCGSVLGKGFDCGEVAPKTILCYPRTYKTTTYYQGHDCSLDGKCVVGYLCTGLPGDADRYCASSCAADTDCPPSYRCATTRTGKDLDKEKRCLLRRLCHPCAIDDQCGGPDDLCIRDKNGSHYCSKSCTATGATCPDYAKCEDAGNSKLQCKHKAGYCFTSFKKEGQVCDPCIVHGWKKVGSSPYTQPTTIAEEGACKDGLFCQLLDRYSGDAGCIEPCASDQCPTGHTCWDALKTATDLWFKPIFGERMCAPNDTDGYMSGCFSD